MVKQRLFLGSVAFGISFGISFLTGRDVGKAIASGLTTGVVAVAASVVVDRQYQQQAHTRIANLKDHIQALQQRRAEAYQAYIQLEAGKEQLLTGQRALPFQPSHLQLMSAPPRNAPLPAARSTVHKALSWNLATSTASDSTASGPAIAKPYELPTEIATGGRLEGENAQEVLAEAVAAKRKIEATLTALQAELDQLKGQITNHRQTKDKLTRELADLREQKRQTEAETKLLKSEVQSLENDRVALEHFLVTADAKKQALETDTKPLQDVLKQLQAHVDSQQVALSQLDAELVDRCRQKAALEQQLAALTAPPLTARPLQRDNNSAQQNGDQRNGSVSAAAHSNKAVESSSTSVSNQPVATVKLAPSKASSASVAAVLPEPIVVEKVASDLPTEWTEFMVQLPEYELQVLKVIVEQANPAAVIKRIAEANLTMPELLIDSINERALDTVGDLLITAGSGSASAAIVRDHLKLVKKLIKTYEYLVN